MTQQDDNTMNTRDKQEVMQENLRALADRQEFEASRTALAEQHNNEDELDIPYAEIVPSTGDTNLPALVNDNTLVHGISLDPELPIEENIKLLTMASSYIGVIPHKVDEFVNRTVTMLGCALAPIEHIDEQTGVVNRWHAVLFKLEDVDSSGNHIILNGGGKQGFQFARSAYQAFGPGDWPFPMEIHISQEARTSKDGQPRRMYRFLYIGMKAKKGK